MAVRKLTDAYLAEEVTARETLRHLPCTPCLGALDLCHEESVNNNGTGTPFLPLLHVLAYLAVADQVEGVAFLALRDDHAATVEDLRHAARHMSMPMLHGHVQTGQSAPSTPRENQRTCTLALREKGAWEHGYDS